MARRGTPLPAFASILQEIATPACGLVRNDTVVGTLVSRFESLYKLQFACDIKQRARISPRPDIFSYIPILMFSLSPSSSANTGFRITTSM